MLGPSLFNMKQIKKARMVSELFSSWLKKLDKKFKQDKRGVAMVVDNCRAHPNIQSKLESITLIFLPSNTTSKSQPCDQGIIQNLKVHYRKHLLLQLVTSIDAGKEFEHNLLDALYLLRLSWSNVKCSTVSGCLSTVDFQISLHL